MIKRPGPRPAHLAGDRRRDGERVPAEPGRILPASQAALAGFIASSACCALAPTIGMLIATRMRHGLAGAPVVLLALGLLLE